MEKHQITIKTICTLATRDHKIERRRADFLGARAAVSAAHTTAGNAAILDI